MGRAVPKSRTRSLIEGYIAPLGIDSISMKMARVLSKLDRYALLRVCWPRADLFHSKRKGLYDVLLYSNDHIVPELSLKSGVKKAFEQDHELISH